MCADLSIGCGLIHVMDPVHRVAILKRDGLKGSAMRRLPSLTPSANRCVQAQRVARVSSPSVVGPTAALLIVTALLSACGSVLPQSVGADSGPALSAADPQRGRALYEVRCIECHSQSVHHRTARAARDFTGVIDQVRRWDRNLGASWTADDISDVAVFLNAEYYKYPCPAPLCSAARTQRGINPMPAAYAASSSPPSGRP